MTQNASLPTAEIERLAVFLHEAETGRREVDKITDELPELSHADAYKIQRHIFARKQQAGGRLVARKMGLTSFSKMKQMGVSTPIHGFLMDNATVADGGTAVFDELIHPKVEAEIAVTTTRDLQGPGCTAAQAQAAIGHVFAAIEVIDSRYRNFRFDLASVIADNTSAARYVVGAQGCTTAGLDLRTIGVVLEKNGEVLATGAGAAVLGHPAAALAALVNLMAEQGESLPAGTLVLTGAATEAFAVAKGDNVTVRVQGVGSASLRFV
jgi:2-oxo-3-hexenedioate decarboxylase